MLKCKLHSLSLTKIHFSLLILLLFNWVFSATNLFNSGIPSNFVKIFPLKKLFFSNEKIINLIKKYFIDFLCLNFFFQIIFSLVNCILNSNILTELDEMPKLNKFETWRTQLNESKVKWLKWISIKLKECN